MGEPFSPDRRQLSLAFLSRWNRLWISRRNSAHQPQTAIARHGPCTLNVIRIPNRTSGTRLGGQFSITSALTPFAFQLTMLLYRDD